jgi:NAD(P)H-dependent FMN reductase
MSTAPESTGKKVAVIIGSTRAKRIGPQVSKFVVETLLAAEPTVTFSLLDIADFNLPVFDETSLPATVPTMGGTHEHEHTKVWSKAISAFDGYVVVSPEYNFGTPSAIKNAIDYLYNEWIGKPIVVVTYGIMGGASASDSLEKTFKGMHLDVVATRPQLTFPGANPEQHNMSPSLIAAMGGELHEESLVAWKGDAATEIAKAGAELKTKLLAEKVAH